MVLQAVLSAFGGCAMKARSGARFGLLRLILFLPALGLLAATIYTIDMLFSASAQPQAAMRPLRLCGELLEFKDTKEHWG
jgi:hypothetical protein